MGIEEEWGCWVRGIRWQQAKTALSVGPYPFTNCVAGSSDRAREI
jgi:hypothetical protein